MIYLVFGSANSPIEDLLILLITHYVSNVSPFLVFIQFYLFWISYRNQDEWDMGFAEVHFLMLLFNLATTGIFWEQTMRISVDAIRYMDPSWDEVAEGERLWP